jgi:hypothetical protein
MTSTFSLTQTGAAANEPVPVTNQEEQQLRRVFDRLCDYDARTTTNNEITALTASIRMLKTTGRLKDAEELQNKVTSLQNELAHLENKKDKKFSCADVFQMMQTLKYKITKLQVEEYVWEVDEDLDQCVNWNEMKLMYTRNLRDKTGLEPNRIFNVTQFLIYDRNENNKVSVDETMNMLYARYGRAKMEMKLKELFGANMMETGREGGEIGFTAFIGAVDKVQLEMFWKTTKGRIISQTTSGRKSLETLVNTVTQSL